MYNGLQLVLANVDTLMQRKIPTSSFVEVKDGLLNTTIQPIEMVSVDLSLLTMNNQYAVNQLNSLCIRGT